MQKHAFLFTDDLVSSNIFYELLKLPVVPTARTLNVHSVTKEVTVKPLENSEEKITDNGISVETSTSSAIDSDQKNFTLTTSTLDLLTCM